MLIKFLEKFFIATIFSSIFACQVAFAANWDIPIDWSKAKQVSSKSDLANYL